MNATKDIINALYRTDLAAYTKKAYEIITSKDDLIWGWYLDAMTYVLSECVNGNIKRLIITMPPRYLKSISASVALPSYILGHDPEARVICASYSQELVLQHASDTRLLMASDWYHDIYPDTALSLIKNTQNLIVTGKNGFRYAVSVGGSLTGIGGDFIIIDDAHKADEINSEPKRQHVLDWFNNTAITRLNNKKEGVIILIMQRLHQGDLPGHLLEKGGWHHLNLPAIAEKDDKIQIGPDKFYQRYQGDILLPERESKEDLDQLESDMGEYGFASQYQQRPSPLKGGIIKLNWFETYYKLKHRMHAEFVIQAWDTAITANENSDYTCCMTAYAMDGKLYIADVLRVKVNYPDLKGLILNHAAKYGVTNVIIETTGSGSGIYQQINQHILNCSSRPFTLTPDVPKESKADRLMKASPVVGDGRVFLLSSADWLDPFLTELQNFPNGVYDDQVDALSMILRWAINRYLIYYK